MTRGQNAFLRVMFTALLLGVVSTDLLALSTEEFIAARTKELNQMITDALKSKGPNYRPRTEHLNKDGSAVYNNRLILEDSPYLIQHAHNPVDWHAWGPEAFAKAKRENKPIFLSIGYSTCHWCHVMERESFENLEIARVLNKHFISIKVDREQHPDIDETYMLAVMLIANHGGWPMSSFLTPEGKPFYGGTYFKPDVFNQMLTKIAVLWEQDRADLEQQADRVAQAVARAGQSRLESSKIDDQVIQKAAQEILTGHDELQGGFSQAPKFPQESVLFLLLQVAERNSDKQALQAVKNTLDAMARGGIHDQVAGGFHRYSTDNEWLVPHFEKMLYNQAHLARVYILAWRLTGELRFKRVAEQTINYVLRDMTSPKGGFYSATDADSEGAEGRFFLWTKDEVKAALSKDDANLAIKIFGMDDRGNYEGSNILHMPISISEFAINSNVSDEELYRHLERIREALYLAREKRSHPLRDEKVITAWNGMMISTLALAADLLGNPAYLEAAKRAAQFIWDNNWRQEGELWRVHLDGRSSVVGSQEDYAYLAEGLIHLFDATGDRIWLERAKMVSDVMLKEFWDEDGGGFYLGPADRQMSAMGRLKESDGDAAMPSGNSVALRAFQMLSRRTDNLEYPKLAEATLAAFSGMIKIHPSGFGYMLTAVQDLTQGELSARGFAAQGGIRIEAELLAGLKLSLRMEIPKGWHINSDRPLQKSLIATKLDLKNNARGWELKDVSYPKADTKKLGFQSKPLSLYQGVVEIQADFKRIDDGVRMLPLQLSLQACNDKVCLPPEKVYLILPIASVGIR